MNVPTTSLPGLLTPQEVSVQTDTRELLARVKAVLRRSNMRPRPAEESASGTLEFDGWKIDIAKRELRNDLEGASDEEDRRDAWEEYRQEIADAKADYRKEMRERGYSVGRVIVEDGD